MAKNINKGKTKTIKLDHITKIEGHAKLTIQIVKNKLKSFPGRLFPINIKNFLRVY